MCSVVFRYWCLYAKCMWLNSSVQFFVLGERVIVLGGTVINR